MGRVGVVAERLGTRSGTCPAPEAGLTIRIPWEATPEGHRSSDDVWSQGRASGRVTKVLRCGDGRVDGSRRWSQGVVYGRLEHVFESRAALMVDRVESAALLALTEAATAARVHWYEIADLVEQVGSAVTLVNGEAELYDRRDLDIAARVRDQVDQGMTDKWSATIEKLLADEATRLVTVLDDEYPANLRRIYNRPPFLFVRGTLRDEDARSVAVVGTRKASPEGRAQARHLATELARRGVTVVSGLAAGIDSEAHTAALNAGGRTLAVMGTGIDRVYPAENRELAARVPKQGALVSQFWPGAPPRAENFPLRNVVSSGIAMGTVVVEASGKSGARMQARLALEHGKRLFLVEPLVLQEQWAQDYAERPGATVVKGVEDVLTVLDAEQAAETTAQLSFF